MNLCKVLGTVVATEKLAVFAGRKILVVQPLDETQKPMGKSYLAIDHTSCAGKGDTVLVMNEGSGVRQVLQDKTAPIRSLIVGVVDAVDVPKAR
ncbi:MAG: EutN/CcmL family microcompartment protein [Archangium sp.]